MKELVKISEATPDGAGKVFLRFVGGAKYTLNLVAYAKQGGVFERLNDPQYAAKVKVVEQGRILRWPGELDFCADALYMKATKAKQHLTVVGTGPIKPKSKAASSVRPKPKVAASAKKASTSGRRKAPVTVAKSKPRTTIGDRKHPKH